MNTFKEKPGDDTGMQTRVWGPAGWLFLHSIAQNYPWKPTPEQQNNYLIFFKQVGNVLPCRYCRESYQKFAKSLSIETMKDRKSIVTWLYLIHQKVNKKLGINDCYSLKQLWDKYESFRSKCTKSEPEKKVKPKKGCLDPMKGLRKKCVINVVDVDVNGNSFGSPNKYSESDLIRLLNKFEKNQTGIVRSFRNDVPFRNRYFSFLKWYYYQDPDDEIKQRVYSFLVRLNEDAVPGAMEIAFMFQRNNSSFGKSTSKNIKLVSIKKSKMSVKKLTATFDINGKKKIVHFGQKSASDYTKHNQIIRRNRYIFRHYKDLKTNDPTRAGYLSMFVLWNKKSLQASITDYRRRLSVYNRTGKFPTKITGYR